MKNVMLKGLYPELPKALCYMSSCQEVPWKLFADHSHSEKLETFDEKRDA